MSRQRREQALPSRRQRCLLHAALRYSPSAACAAASRAIGTRNGEQLT